MAFKMKGFPYSGKSPIKDIQGDGTLQGTNHHHNNKHYDGMKHDKDGNWIEEAKPAPKFKSALKQVDPDAPGTPGKPGHEPGVKREDLDELGKKIWDCHRNPKTKWNNKTKKCEPIKPK